MRAELAQKQGSAGISEAQLANIKAEAARQAKEEVSGGGGGGSWAGVGCPLRAGDARDRA